MNKWSHYFRIYGVPLGIGIAFIALIFMLPSVLWAYVSGPNIFFTNQIHALDSPDSKHQIIVERRVHFPAFTIFDNPPATITIKLKDSHRGNTMHQIQFDIHEFHELQKPEVIWNLTEVIIDDIETHRDMLVVMRLPQQ